MTKKFFYILFIYFLLIFKSFSAEFIGVIGVAVGEINNQNKSYLLFKKNTHPNIFLLTKNIDVSIVH